MSYTSGFFDAVDLGGGNYDREYSAAVFAHYFSLLVKNGVFPDPSTGMQVKASSSPDMHVSVQPGSGWINGYYITVPDDSPEVLTVPTANPSLSRIDSVIMGLNYVEREIQLYIKSGAVSASPSAVSLQRDNDLYEMELAQITVAAGVASISQANITDMRQNTSRCGIVKGTIDQIDTTDLFAQYDDAFQTWFADIQAQLSGDVATNLQNQINNLKDGKADTSVTDSLQNQVTSLKSDKVNVSDKASTAQAQAGTNNTKWMTPALALALLNYRLATTAEAQAGSVDNKWMTPAKVKAWWDSLYTTMLLPVSKGGTGKPSWYADRLLYASSRSALSQLNFPSVVGSVLAQGTSGAAYWRSDMITVIDLLKGLTESAGESVTITWRLTSAVSGGVVVSLGGIAQNKAVGDYAQFTAKIPNAADSTFLFYLDSTKLTTGGSNGYPSDKFTLYINSVAYDLGVTTLSGANNQLTSRQIAVIVGKLPTSSIIQLRETCVTNPGSYSISFGEVGSRTTTSTGRVYKKEGMS